MSETKSGDGKTKTMPCRVCGKPLTRGIRTRKEQRCLECGIQESIDAMIQMKQKSGPYYDKWLARVAGAASINPRATPPSDTGMPDSQQT